MGFVQYLALQAYKVNYVIQIVNGEQCSSREVATPLPLQLCPMLGFRSIPGNTGMRSLSVSCRVHSELGSDSLSHQLAEKGQDCLDELRVTCHVSGIDEGMKCGFVSESRKLSPYQHADLVIAGIF